VVVLMVVLLVMLVVVLMVVLTVVLIVVSVVVLIVVLMVVPILVEEAEAKGYRIWAMLPRVVTALKSYVSAGMRISGLGLRSQVLSAPGGTEHRLPSVIDLWIKLSEGGGMPMTQTWSTSATMLPTFVKVRVTIAPLIVALEITRPSASLCLAYSFEAAMLCCQSRFTATMEV